MDWNTYKESLTLRSEEAVHPDTCAKKANLFSATTSSATEVEFLDLLHCLVFATKPQLVLETGTFTALGTIAMAYALQKIYVKTGYKGHIFSIESNEQLASHARTKIRGCCLHDFVTVINSDTVKFIEDINDSKKFDLMFFDSSRPVRPQEYKALKENNLIANGALLIFHDTAQSPVKTTLEERRKQREYIDALETISDQCSGRISMEVSRGLSILQFSYSPKEPKRTW